MFNTFKSHFFPPILTAGGAKSTGAIMSQWAAIHPSISSHPLPCTRKAGIELKNYNLNPYLLAFKLKKKHISRGLKPICSTAILPGDVLPSPARSILAWEQTSITFSAVGKNTQELYFSAEGLQPLLTDKLQPALSTYRWTDRWALLLLLLRNNHRTPRRVKNSNLCTICV